MSDLLPTVPLSAIVRAMSAVIEQQGLNIPEGAVLSEFGMPRNASDLELYNAVARRVQGLNLLLQYCKPQLKAAGLTDYQLLAGAAFAPLDYTDDGWELSPFIAIAKQLPSEP